MQLFFNYVDGYVAVYYLFYGTNEAVAQMKKYLTGFWYSLPIQLVLLHCRKYQIFLLFWYILFSTLNGGFLNTYGASSLFLAPEYMGNVNALSAAIVGITIGVFVMSWNITTFILHGNLLKFLATTAQPFLKYCINNALLPIAFILFYFLKVVDYDAYEELLDTASIIAIVAGFTGGFLAAVLVGFIYFFSADKSIYNTFSRTITLANRKYERNLLHHPFKTPQKYDLRVDWFLSARLRLRKPRDVRHYSNDFLDAIFKRHHLAAVFAILFAFISLIIIGFFSDKSIFKIPAAASITIFFAILIGVSGAVYLFLHSWTLPILLLVYSFFNLLYEREIFDPRNKVYGLNYPAKGNRPLYCKDTIQALASNANVTADKQRFLKTLNLWKQQQQQPKPVLVIINVSGGGNRSASFAINALQRIDSQLNGQLLKHTILISGASGGMLGAAYYRQLYYEKQKGIPVNLCDLKYADDIAKDLLNPLFSSFVARDIIGPVQKFAIGNNEYVKDRGYAFEQQLNANTNGILDFQLKDYVADEATGKIPTMLFNSVISRDGRKMVIGTQPMRFLMRPVSDVLHKGIYDPDAIDFSSFFGRTNTLNIKLLSALRMNATFPYVLPNVWLPSEPIIDVMDAGLRDNFGQETSLRFIETFKDWMQQNTAKIILLQIRDHSQSDWDISNDGNSIGSFFTKPLLLLQNNWFNIQDYYQHDQLEYLYRSYGSNFHQVCFQYVSKNKGKAAGLSFHLTAAEKKDIAASLDNPMNVQAMNEILGLMQ